jgi:5'-nucleotidase
LNHDLDFGIRQFRYLTARCNFPWLLANILDPELGEDVPLGNARKTHMMTMSNGLKIGFIGLGEREWLATVNAVPPNLIYRSASEVAKELAPALRAQGADMVIAVTHQREPNDNKLAEKTGSEYIDLILGGHDHYYSHSLINGTHVLRSGSDFKQLSYIEGWKRSDGSPGWDFKITRRDVVSSILEDISTVEEVKKLTDALKGKLEKPIGYTAAPLDARFTTVRTTESNMGNFVCDLMRYYYNTDCCIIASGTVRGDQIYPPGLLRLKDIMNCFPFEDPVIVVKVSGKAILDALESSVSLYPALEGRFPQVSNIEFTFDPSLPAGKRVLLQNVKIGDGPIDLEKKYVLATRGYMGRGKDGYKSLLVKSEGGEAEEIVNEENGVLISTILRQYFISLRVLGKWKQWSPSLDSHFSAVNKRLHRRHSVVEPHASTKTEKAAEAVKGKVKSLVSHLHETRASSGADTPLNEESDEDNDSRAAVGASSYQRDHEKDIARRVLHKWFRLAGLQGSPAMCDAMKEEEFKEKWTRAIAPRLEGRIKMVQHSKS